MHSEAKRLNWKKLISKIEWVVENLKNPLKKTRKLKFEIRHNFIMIGKKRIINRGYTSYSE